MARPALQSPESGAGVAAAQDPACACTCPWVRIVPHTLTGGGGYWLSLGQFQEAKAKADLAPPPVGKVVGSCEPWPLVLRRRRHSVCSVPWETISLLKGFFFCEEELFFILNLKGLAQT